MSLSAITVTVEHRTIYRSKQSKTNKQISAVYKFPYKAITRNYLTSSFKIKFSIMCNSFMLLK